jgi:hypothetical protein
VGGIIYSFILKDIEGYPMMSSAALHLNEARNEAWGMNKCGLIKA